jgi:heat shock protein HtpX
MSQFYNNAKTVLLLGLMTGLIMAVGSFWGSGGLEVALVFAAIMSFGSYFFSDKIALMSMRAQEVGPEHELYQIVQPLAERAGLPMPRVYVSPHMAPNAFATGRSPNHAAVCATQGLLQMLNRNEIAGVMGHELGHVLHRDMLIQTIAATIAGAIGSIVWWFPRGENGREHPLAGLIMIIAAPMAASLIQLAISRSREYNADKEGAELCGDPMALATALEKIHAAANRVPMDVNPAFNSLMIAEPRNAMRSLATLFATHPPLEKRLLNLIGRQSTGMV